MVHIHDEGSEFDASIDNIWKYLGTPEVHGPAHKSRRNVQVKPVNDNTVHVEFEQQVGDQWVKVRNRVTTFPPVGNAVEMLDGPLGGSKFLTYYTPKGTKTGITVIGEFVSKTLPPAQVEAAALRALETSFNEDNAALKTFKAKP